MDEFDELLIAALYRSSEHDYGDMPPDDELERIVRPTANLQRKIRTLIYNPVGKLHNQRLPIHLRILRVAAIVIIAFALVLSMAMAVSPTVRAAVTNFVRSWFEDRTVYESTTNNPDGDWAFEYLPDGFCLEHEMIAEHQVSRIYKNNEKQLFVSIANNAVTVDNEHHDFYQTVINGHLADVYEQNTGEHMNIIIAYFEEAKAIVFLSSEIAVNELIKIIENISY